MKKSLIIALAMVFVLSVAGTAFAGPFADVPAGHWAYDAVNKLEKAGIVDGYGDGTYLGEKTITRYEMAQMVAKAMERSDKADAANKALINKLAAEYADELDNLGVRVSTLEKKIGNITWTGQVRSWYDWKDKDALATDALVDDDDNTNLHTRILLWTTAPLTDDMNFIGRFSSWSDWGEADDRVGSSVEMDNAYIQGKNFTFGRQPITLGKGLVYNIGYNNDGATFTVGNKLKLTAAAFKSSAAENCVSDNWLNVNSSADVWVNNAPTVYAANLTYQASDKLDLTAVYAKTKDQNVYIWNGGLNTIDGDLLDTWAAGFGYKGIKNITMTGEYGENRSDAAEAINNDNAKAWVGQIKYKGAEWTKPHTFGVWVGYRDADPGFMGITGDPMWETAFGISPMDNVKGAEYGFDYTLFNNGVFTLNYMDFESNDTDKTDLKSMTAQMRYFF